MDSPPPRDAPPTRSHLFTLRLWYEDACPSQRSLRMQVKYVLTGEMRYFHSWDPLTQYLTQKLDEVGQKEE